MINSKSSYKKLENFYLKIKYFSNKFYLKKSINIKSLILFIIYYLNNISNYHIITFK